MQIEIKNITGDLYRIGAYAGQACLGFFLFDLDAKEIIDVRVLAADRPAVVFALFDQAFLLWGKYMDPNLEYRIENGCFVCGEIRGPHMTEIGRLRVEGWIRRKKKQLAQESV